MIFFAVYTVCRSQQYVCFIFETFCPSFRLLKLRLFELLVASNCTMVHEKIFLLKFLPVYFYIKTDLNQMNDNLNGMPKGHIFCTEIEILNPGSHDISQKLRQTKYLSFEG